ncbi:MAG: hypothetical protein ABL883_10200 [Terricaulis sp.]
MQGPAATRPSGSGGDPHEIWYRFSGRQQAYVGNNGTIDVSYLDSVPQKQNGGPAASSYADFDLAYDPINAGEPTRCNRATRSLVSRPHSGAMRACGTKSPK